MVATTPARPSPEAPIRRRERALGGGEAILLEVLAEKVLQGWMQNRLQVLFPLTVNMRAMPPVQAALLVQMMAVAVLANGSATVAGADRGRVFLRTAGADLGPMQAFEAALLQPPALSGLLTAVLETGMAAYAYVMAMVVVDAREAVGGLFLDYLVSRLALPTAVVRSAQRRYRR